MYFNVLNTTLPEIDTPERCCLEDDPFLFGKAHFQGRLLLVSGRVRFHSIHQFNIISRF